MKLNTIYINDKLKRGRIKGRRKANIRCRRIGKKEKGNREKRGRDSNGRDKKKQNGKGREMEA